MTRHFKQPVHMYIQHYTRTILTGQMCCTGSKNCYDSYLCSWSSLSTPSSGTFADSGRHRCPHLARSRVGAYPRGRHRLWRARCSAQSRAPPQFHLLSVLVKRQRRRACTREAGLFRRALHGPRGGQRRNGVSALVPLHIVIVVRNKFSRYSAARRHGLIA